MTTEKTIKAASGWAMLPVNLLIFSVGRWPHWDCSSRKIPAACSQC